jgi:hypothetical protein
MVSLKKIIWFENFSQVTKVIPGCKTRKMKLVTMLQILISNRIILDQDLDC